MQNRSTAVMQRRVKAPDALEYFPTPPWATRALCEFLLAQGEPLGAQSAWEPACGEGHMARPLAEYFDAVRATDVFRYSQDHGICDFLDPFASAQPIGWVVTNPPFLLAEQFITRARECAMRGVAMLVRTAFLESETRASLFAEHPPTWVLPFAERVVMLRGRLIRAGAVDPFNPQDDGRPRKASTATSYCWIVWIAGQADTRLRWLGKCRQRLERAGDYPEYPVAAAQAEGALL